MRSDITRDGRSFQTHPLVFAAGTAVLMSAAAVLVLTGLAGVGRSLEINLDGVYLYAAGKCWLQGKSPYDLEALASELEGRRPDGGFPVYRFFYPPQISSLVMIIALIPYGAAKWFTALINCLAAGAIAWFVGRMARPRDTAPGMAQSLAPFVFAAIAIGAPFTAHVVWMGQTTLIAFAPLFAAWHAYQNKRWLAAAVLLGIASIKPQFLIFVMFWLLLERQWKILGASFAVALLLSMVPILQNGPIGALTSWLDAVKYHGEAEPNQIGFIHLFGVQNFLHVAGLPVPNLIPVGAVLTLILWIWRKNVDPIDIFAILMALTLLFTNAHDYDLVGIYPLLASLWRHIDRQPAIWAVAALLLLALFIPQRLVARLGAPLLSQWRVIVVMILLTWTIRIMYKAAWSGERQAPA